MRYLFTQLLIALFTATTLPAAGLQQKLTEVNSNWPANADGIALLQLQQNQAPTTETEWIALHLQLVEQTLRARKTDGLTPTQRKNRLACLNNLHAYWQQGVFPVNDYLPYRNPVFIDKHNTFCAVGYLMKTSGSETLARKVDAQQKFAYVKDIKEEGVNEWATHNGFALSELAWIQPTYPCVHAGCPTATVRNPSCYGLNDGCIGPDPAGITPPYTYEIWTGHDTSGTNFGLQFCDLWAGDYTVRITDINGGKHYQFYTLISPDSLSSSLATAPVTPACSGTNSVHSSGGTGSIGYLWSSGETDSVAVQLCPGKNWVRSTDQNGCAKTDSFLVAVQSGISNLESVSWKLFPNPAQTFIELQGAAVVAAHLTLVNTAGEKLPVVLNSNRLDVRALPAGAYYLVVNGYNPLRFIKTANP